MPEVKHTLEHALDPAATNCRHNMADITNCVLCERRLKPDRSEVDTCGRVCWEQLLEMQRRASFPELYPAGDPWA